MPTAEEYLERARIQRQENLKRYRERDLARLRAELLRSGAHPKDLPYLLTLTPAQRSSHLQEPPTTKLERNHARQQAKRAQQAEEAQIYQRQLAADLLRNHPTYKPRELYTLYMLYPQLYHASQRFQAYAFRAFLRSIRAS